MSVLLSLLGIVIFGALLLWLLRRWRRQTSSIAAAPPPGQIDPDSAEDSSVEDTVEDRLVELDELLSRGQITRGEYEARRKDLIKSVPDS